MANDERQSQTFIREVDEELRRDQLKTLWTRFAPLIIGVCVLIVVVTAGYRGWLWWEERKAAQAGDAFIQAIEAISSGNKAEGDAELQKIAAEGGAGYAVLARLRLAGEQAGAGQKAEALSAYDGVAGDQSVPQPLRDFARIRAALLALDTGDLAGAKERAEALNVVGNPWLHQAREIIGTSAYQGGDLKAARDIFGEMQQDAQTPPDLWMRAGFMVSLIDGQFAVPGPEAPAAPPTEPAAPSEPDSQDPGAAAEAGPDAPAAPIAPQPSNP